MISVDEPQLAAPVFPAHAGPGNWDGPLKAAILLGLTGLLFLSVQLSTQQSDVALSQVQGAVPWLLRPSMIWACLGIAALGLRTLLWFRYRPHSPAEFDRAPRLTVVIPAYNEGPMVLKAIDSVASARYPPDRLEIMVVDDGSTDDTWEYIRQGVARHGERIRAIRLKRNCGKREALARGFRAGTGEVFVTVDSDSVISPGALLALAGPFASPRVGVVAGKVLAYNRTEGLIPRMLNVRFTLAFDFLRAYQSSFGTVYCSPGALSAYRASAVMRVLERWKGQRFLGAPATIGEDRALTNDVMRLGYDSLYQREAVVLTVVPLRYSRLCRMFLRWDRSYIREEIRLLRVLWRRPFPARLLAFVDVALSDIRFPILTAVFIYVGVTAVYDPWVLLRIVAAIGFTSLLYSLYYLRSERSPDFLYGVVFEYYSFFLMFWVFPWALLSVRARGWLTR